MRKILYVGAFLALFATGEAYSVISSPDVFDTLTKACTDQAEAIFNDTLKFPPYPNFPVNASAPDPTNARCWSCHSAVCYNFCMVGNDGTELANCTSSCFTKCMTGKTCPAAPDPLCDWM